MTKQNETGTPVLLTVGLMALKSLSVISWPWYLIVAPLLLSVGLIVLAELLTAKRR